MGNFDIFKKESSGSGYIGYYGLSNWWLNELTEDDRRVIRIIFKPIGDSSESLIKGNIPETTCSNVRYLLLRFSASWKKC